MLGQGAIQSLKLGQLGSKYITGTSAYTGQWGRIYCITACTFSVLTSGNFPTAPGALVTNTTPVMTNVNGTGDVHGIALGAGMEIQGLFTAITLASGSVIAYNV